jgi:hypothetical protein
MSPGRAQIGDLERNRIAEALRDIEDVLQQMGVEPKLMGFIGRIRKPARIIAHTCDLPDPEPEFSDNVVRLEGLRKAPAIRLAAERIEASRVDPLEAGVKAMLEAAGQTEPTSPRTGSARPT